MVKTPGHLMDLYVLAQGITPVTYKNFIKILSRNGSVRTIPWRPTIPAIPIAQSIPIENAEQSYHLS
jgi:hypothetical protein